MLRSERRIIDNIILINPMLEKLQSKIEDEQERVIADKISPAKKTVAALIALDNRRIDLCNLNVLYSFIARGLGSGFSVLSSCADTGADSGLYDVARSCIESAGYTLERAAADFEYLFKNIVRKRGRPVHIASADAMSRQRVYYRYYP